MALVFYFLNIKMNYKIDFEALFNLANEFKPKHRTDYYNIVDDFSNVAKEKVEKETNDLNSKLTKEEQEELLDRFTTDEWIEATTISDVYISNKKLEELLKLTPKQRTLLAIRKLEKLKDKQIEVWRNFLSQFNKNSIEEEIVTFRWIMQRTPMDSPKNHKILHTLLAIKEQLSWESEAPENLVVRWVFWLLSSHDEDIKIYYLSDTIKDLDTAKQRIKAHYDILERKYWVNSKIEFHWSAPSRSFQTWAQVIQLIWQSSEISFKKHWLKTCPKLFFLVNNADRWKHRNKEKAQWSECLWARVKENYSNVVHDIIWVDHEVFTIFKENIKELYMIEWIPWDEQYGDLSKWTQFRSLHNFPYVQFLNTISWWWAPAWFRVKKLDIEKSLYSLDIADDEAILMDPDHYWNWKSLSSHKDWIFGVCKTIWAKMDKDIIIWDFFHPDSWNKMFSMEFVPTEYLWKHTWEKCVWNWSSRGLDWKIFVEIWISKKEPDDIVKEVVEAPVWTRVKFRKK